MPSCEGIAIVTYTEDELRETWDGQYVYGTTGEMLLTPPMDARTASMMAV